MYIHKKKHSFIHTYMHADMQTCIHIYIHTNTIHTIQYIHTKKLTFIHINIQVIDYDQLLDKMPGAEDAVFAWHQVSFFGFISYTYQSIHI